MTLGASPANKVVLLSHETQVKVRRLPLSFRETRAKASSLILRKVSKPATVTVTDGIDQLRRQYETCKT